MKCPLCQAVFAARPATTATTAEPGPVCAGRDRPPDGNEKDGYRDEAEHPVQGGSTPLYRPEDSGRVDYDAWFRAGGDWQGGY